MVVHWYALLDVLLALRGPHAVLDQLFTLGPAKAMVLRAGALQREVREGCQVEGLTTVQERPKYPSRYRYNGLTSISAVVEGESLQDTAETG